MKKSHTLSVLWALFLSVTSPTYAALLNFDLAWSGASFSNTYTATGTLTLDDALFGSSPPGDLASVGITALTVTITGGPDAGTWSTPDFAFAAADQGTCGPINFATELVGQNGCLFDHTIGGSDFNLFGGTPGSPVGCKPNILCTSSGIPMALTSFTPTPVPVPAALWLFGSGLLGLVGVARRKARA